MQCVEHAHDRIEGNVQRFSFITSYADSNSRGFVQFKCQNSIKYIKF